MPTKTYYLDAACTDAITAKWGIFYQNFTVRYAGAPLAAVDPDAAIAKGRDYLLPDGRTFSAQLKETTYPQQLELLIDGQPVPGSGTHPQERIRQAWYTLLFLGVLNIGLGLWAEFGYLEVFRQYGLGWGSVVEGVVFLALGWAGYYRGSVLALTTAFVVLVLESIYSIGTSLVMGQSAAFGGIFMRLFFCLTVFRGMKAAWQWRQEQPTLQP